MKPFHEFIHCQQSVRCYNEIVKKGDLCLSLLKDENTYGEVLNVTLDDLKFAIHDNAQRIEQLYSGLNTFINWYDTYDFEQFTNKARYTILLDKEPCDVFSAALETNIEKPQIKDKNKLAEIAAQMTNPINYAAPLWLETPYHYALMLNDWLDTCSYVCRDINYFNGEPKTYTNEQKTAIITGALNQYPNLLHIQYPKSPIDLNSEVNVMIGIKDYILANLGTLSWSELAIYIDNHYPRVPLMRRLWDIG